LNSQDLLLINPEILQSVVKFPIVKSIIRQAPTLYSLLHLCTLPVIEIPEMFSLFKNMLDFRMRFYDWNRSKQTKEIDDFVELLQRCESHEIFDITTQSLYNPRFEWIEPLNVTKLLDFLAGIHIPEEHTLKYKEYLLTNIEESSVTLSDKEKEKKEKEINLAEKFAATGRALAQWLYSSHNEKKSVPHLK